jgi:hypothetical protein
MEAIQEVHQRRLSYDEKRRGVSSFVNAGAVWILLRRVFGIKRSEFVASTIARI